MCRITPTLYFSLFFLCCFGKLLTAQTTDYFVVNAIELEGNNKTKDRIIYREIDFDIGDTIYVANLAETLNENKKRILNTGLFTLVNINMKNWDMSSGKADMEITLTENWYIYPLPIFELADRNFNVWWNEQNRSLSRVNYGGRITHINFTGNRDALRLVTHFGYTRKFELKYNYPFINKEQTLGVFGNVFYSDRKEIGYKTENNKTLYAEFEDKVLLTRFRINGRLEYRPDLKHFHRFNVGYHHNTIDDYVALDLNPDYFLNGETDLKFFVLEYQYRWDNRIFFFYPEGGNMFTASLKKEGLGIYNKYNNLSLSAEYEHHFKAAKRWLLGARLKAKTNLLRNKVAFANNTGLGYGVDFIRGYELYVLDGTDYLYVKTSIKFKLIEKLWNINKAMPINAFKKMFFQVFLSANWDAGYVNERDYIETNEFNNRFVYGYGPGLDIILYNNYLFKIEYSINHIGEGGLYLSNLINF